MSLAELRPERPLRHAQDTRSDWGCPGWDTLYPAPAKLNLFLHVIGRRGDGYHQLQTLFRFVDHGDSLRFSPRRDGALRLVRPLPGVPPETDLCLRAARLLREATGCRQGADILVDKRLPMGGGLGGGSSDAATVLLALNHLWRLGLSRQRLQALGLALGADVPVFLFGRNAFAEGIGEILHPVDLPPAWYVVLEPPVAVPTAAIFSAPELKRDTPAISPDAFSPWRPGFGKNDLPLRLRPGTMPPVEMQNMEQVPATSTACPGSKTPQPNSDCMVSPAPAQTGIPARKPVRAADSSESVPTMSQGFTIRGMSAASIPNRASCSSDQRFCVTS